MSEGGFHVHGAHEHALEHGAHPGKGLAQYVAIFTAILSTCGAIISYQGGETQTEAMLLKNEAVLKKAEASDQWAFYQAKSNKGHLMELAMELEPAKANEYRAKVNKYELDKAEIKAKAEALDQVAKTADDRSAKILGPHYRLSQAMTFIQIAISLASITILTRKKWLFSLAGVAALAGAGLWGFAYLI
jgi:Domain of unknown function (DUF4337)